MFELFSRASVDAIAAAVGAYTGWLGGVIPIGGVFFLPGSAALTVLLTDVLFYLFNGRGQDLATWGYWKNQLRNAAIIGIGVAATEVVLGLVGLPNPLLLAVAAGAIGYGVYTGMKDM